MNKKIILIIGGVIVIGAVIGLVVYFMMQKPVEKPKPAAVLPAETVESKIAKIKAEFTSKESNKREEALSQLSNIKHPMALQMLLECLNDNNAKVRDRAAKMLGVLGEKNAVGPLCRAMKDKDYYVNFSAAVSLAKLGSAYGAELLISRLKTDPDVPRKIEAIEALGKIKYIKALPLISQLEKSKDAQVQQSAKNVKLILEKQKKLNDAYEWYRSQVKFKAYKNINDKLFVLNQIKNKEDFKNAPLDFSAIDKEIKELQQELERKSAEEMKKMQDAKKDLKKQDKKEIKKEVKKEEKKEDKKETSKETKKTDKK